MIVKTATTVASLVSIALCASALPATAKTRHRHPSRAPTLQSPSVGARDPAKFYPDEIEGGVRGNLSFNNQLRKLSDPLNANGGGR